MTNEEIAVRIQAGEQHLMGELYEQNKGLFYIMAGRLYALNRNPCISAGVEFDDIIQVCFFALCDAVKAYKADGEYNLSSYLKFPLKNHFNRLLGIKSRVKGAQCNDALNQSVSLDEPLGDSEDDTTHIDMLADPDSERAFEAVVDGMVQSELRDIFEKLISNLPERRADIMRSYFFGGKTQEQIALEYGVSVAAINSSIREATQTLKQDSALQSYRSKGTSHRDKKVQWQKENWVASVESTVTKAATLTEQRRERILNALKKGGAGSE